MKLTLSILILLPVSIICQDTLKMPQGVRAKIVIVTDGDGDTVPGFLDNCPTVSNVDQTDTDGDGRGDACEENNAYKAIDADNEILFDQLPVGGCIDISIDEAKNLRNTVTGLSVAGIPHTGEILDNPFPPVGIFGTGSSTQSNDVPAVSGYPFLFISKTASQGGNGTLTYKVSTTDFENGFNTDLTPALNAGGNRNVDAFICKINTNYTNSYVAVYATYIVGTTGNAVDGVKYGHSWKQGNVADSLTTLSSRDLMYQVFYSNTIRPTD